MSGNTFSAVPHDQWITMTMCKRSKMKGEWIGITDNETTLQINSKVVNNFTIAKESLKSVANLKNC